MMRVAMFARWLRSRHARRPSVVVALIVVALYALVALLVAVGAIGAAHDARVGVEWLPPGEGHWLGTDRQGRDILVRTICAAKIAFFVGLVSATIAVVIGSALGMVAGYRRGAIDAAIVGSYSTIESIPAIVLLLAVTHVAGGGLFAVYLALCVTFWTGPCRMLRAETLKLREAPHIEAARALGYEPWRIILVHIVPNTMHLVVANFVVLFIAAVKSEVILSFLGLGVRREPSWGVMIDQSRLELTHGFYWQLGSATVAMFVLMLAFHTIARALADASQPTRATG